MNGLPGMEGDFAKGATGGGNVYDTTPSGLGLSPSYLAQGASATASASSSGTTSITHGKRAASVSTAGTTFGTGADLLAANLTFVADGVSDYVVKVAAVDVVNTAGSQTILHVNFDGADYGTFYAAYSTVASPAPCSGSALLSAPAAGAHTVNVRVRAESAGTSTITGGAGGVGLNLPILVIVSAAS